MGQHRIHTLSCGGRRRRNVYETDHGSGQIPGSHFALILLLIFNKPVTLSTALLSESSCIHSRKQLFYHFTFAFVLDPLPALTVSLKSLFNMQQSFYH